MYINCTVYTHTFNRTHDTIVSTEYNYVHPSAKDSLGPAILSFVEKLSTLQRFKMY